LELNTIDTGTKMKQLDLFLDTDIKYYEDLFSDVTNDDIIKRAVMEAVNWRAQDLNLSPEEYMEWIRKD